MPIPLWKSVPTVPVIEEIAKQTRELIAIIWRANSKDLLSHIQVGVNSGRFHRDRLREHLNSIFSNAQASSAFLPRGHITQKARPRGWLTKISGFMKIEQIS